MVDGSLKKLKPKKNMHAEGTEVTQKTQKKPKNENQNNR
jgi:hypothetical protein